MIYVNSKGEEMEMSTMNTEHILNSLSKKSREIFDVTSQDEYHKRITEIMNLKEELFKRFNDFYGTLGDKDGRIS